MMTEVETLLAQAQQRWGRAALQWGRAVTRTPSPPLPTGWPALDDLLGGGVPPGQFTELLGTPTSGMATVALTLAAQVQAGGGLVAWRDLPTSFDAAYAARGGVTLDQLLLVQPATLTEALDMLVALLDLRAVALIVVDHLAVVQAQPEHAQRLARALRTLPRLLADSPTALVALTPLPYAPAVRQQIMGRGSSVAHAAQLRLHLARDTWHADRLVLGCQSAATLIRHPTRPVPACASIHIPFEPWGDANGDSV